MSEYPIARMIRKYNFRTAESSYTNGGVEDQQIRSRVIDTMACIGGGKPSNGMLRPHIAGK
jgi:hypothetical protein